jgi:trehalose 6-phosphate phosphatase
VRGGDPPSALKCWDELAARLAGRRPVMFLDFDGTLAPIVERPGDAALPAETRVVLERLAAVVPVAILSGRGREDVAARVGIGGIAYAGSHGFDIAGPGGELHAPHGADALPGVVEEAAAELERRLAGVAGAEVEPKRYAVAAHWRRVAAGDLPAVERAVDEVVAAHPELRRAEGNKVFELRPALDWDKGRALVFLLEKLGLEGAGAVPIYVGDDVTDEDAFRALAALEPEPGIGILVAERPRPTAAGYRLRDPGEVRELLARLARLAAGTA